jgi:hypothetical protein
MSKQKRERRETGRRALVKNEASAEMSPLVFTPEFAQDLNPCKKTLFAFY